MILYFSGGGSPWIPEMQIEEPAVMLSYYVNHWLAGKSDTRLRRIILARKFAKRKKARNNITRSKKC